MIRGRGKSGAGRTARLLVISAIMAVGSRAHAQVAAAQAEALFRQGRELLEARKVSEACTAFEQSQKLEPAIATLLNLAGCRELNHQYASAWGYFLQAERETRTAVDADGMKFHGVAEARAAAIERKVSRLTISVTAASQIDGLELLRGTTPVEPSAWNRALPVDGGTYTITARAPGTAPWTTTVTVGEETDTKTVDVPRLQAAAPEENDEDEGEPPTDIPTRSRALALPISLGAVAVLALGGAVAFELSAESTFDESQTEPDPTTSDRLFAKANHKRYAAEALAVTGLVAGGVAVWLYVRDSRDAAVAPSVAASRSVNVAPTFTAAFSGLEIWGRF